MEAFLLSRRVANCSRHTIDMYVRSLGRFARTVGTELAACTSLDVQRYLSGLSQRLKPVSTHQHFRTLRTFFTWCMEVGLRQTHAMRGISMQLPKTLPAVPEDDHVRGLLQACLETFEGRRNRALIALLADSGLRISEALRLPANSPRGFGRGLWRESSGVHAASFQCDLERCRMVPRDHS